MNAIANLTAEEVELVQHRISLFAAFCLDDDLALLLERYIEQSRPQWNGTMDAILPHFMSIRDMRKAQENLKYLCAVGEKLLAVRALAKEQLAKEIANA